MVKTFKLEILASDHVFYSGECDELIFRVRTALSEYCLIISL